MSQGREPSNASAETSASKRRVEGISVKRVFASMASRLGTAQAESVSDRLEAVGDYDLLEEVGRGGMGVVFRARQRSLDREVAVKMLLSGNFAGEDELARFRDEASALAMLDHPHIAPVYEVGDYEGRPYLVMRYLPGGDLGQAVERGEFVGSKDAVSVMSKLADAMDQAHSRGLLHRDLKPANILLDAQRQPHITDFGLARHLGKDSSLTLTGAIVGSPNYMAPEQARADDSSRLTTAADIYSLGALLYHLLTGRPPFLEETPLATLKEVLESEPASPVVFNPNVDRDLATICLHCLEKSPEKRYGSAHELQEDLERWLEGKPIAVRQASARERLVKWAKRRPALASAAGLLIAATIGFIVLVAAYQANLRESRDAALTEKQKAQDANAGLRASVEQLEFERADQEILGGLQREGMRRLVSILTNNPTHRAAAERLAHEWERRRFPIHAAPRIAQPGEDVKKSSYSPDGEWLATASATGTLALFRGEDGSAVGAPLAGVVPAPLMLAFNADGSRLMSVANSAEVGLWSVPDLLPVARWNASSPGAKSTPCAFSPDGLTVVTREGSEVCLRDAKTGELEARLPHDGVVETCVGSPDGEHLFCVINDFGSRRAMWWDRPSKTLRGERPLPAPIYGPDYQASFSADGQRLAMRTRLHALHVFDVATMEPVREPFFHKLRTWRMALDSDGSHVAIGLNSGLFEIREVATDRRITQHVFEVGFIRALTFDPVRPVLAVSTSDGTTTLWDIQTTAHSQKGGGGVEDVHASAYFQRFSADGQTRVSVDRRHHAYLTAHDGTRRRVPVEGAVRDVVLSADGTRLALSRERPDGGSAVEIIDVESLEVEDEVWQAERRVGVHFAPGDRYLLLICYRGGGRLYDSLERTVVFENLNLPGPAPATPSVAFHPDGSWFALMEWEGRARRWDTKTGEPLDTFVEFAGPSNLITLNSDSSHALTGGFDTKLRGWKIDPTGQAQLQWVSRFPGAVTQAAFHPDGERYVAASIEGTVRLGHVRDGSPLGSVMPHDLEVTTAIFTADGRHVLTVSKDQTARLWDAQTGNPVTSPYGHDGWWPTPQIDLPVDRAWLEGVAKATAATTDPADED